MQSTYPIQACVNRKWTYPIQASVNQSWAYPQSLFERITSSIKSMFKFIDKSESAQFVFIMAILFGVPTAFKVIHMKYSILASAKGGSDGYLSN